MAVIQGANGQGKSNLLEAAYVLAIAKSPRASADRELVRWQSRTADAYSQVSAGIERNAGPVKLQIDFRVPTAVAETNSGGGDEDPNVPTALNVQKYIRVNGVPRRTSELVGQLGAVMFSADDLDLVYGSPSVRRRYLDIMISQSDRQYLNALQRYHRITYQRNHLLRMVREARAGRDEMGFWDDELVDVGKQIMARRIQTVTALSELARPIHAGLTDQGESLELVYEPNVQVEASASEDDIAEGIREALVARRERELAQAVTVTGPHRDDLRVLVDGLEAGAYASRGQSRTGVLAMKLAEAGYQKAQRGDEPVLLLDDVLSELDSTRRSRVLETVSGYQQCLITTTDVQSIDARFLPTVSRLAVSHGRVTTLGVGTGSEI
jgi:DNA replication and repair protein RecF